ncbi:MAG: hypothetical protein JO223_23495 [Hyphomicrobiales bacterium]|nr:hypothetical protein [Hyphomicrobiales bacterium]
MPSRIRFTAAGAVFEAFPDLALATEPPPDETGVLEHARALLASPRSSEAIIFLAHLLPRREAVWWAINCVRAMPGGAGEDDALRAADAWVRDPEEDNRRAALAVAEAANPRLATTWLAFAAGWSGGSLSAPDSEPARPPPAACAMAANTAVMLAATRGDPAGVGRRIVACGEAGVRFAEGGSATVDGPGSRADVSETKPPARDASRQNG